MSKLTNRIDGIDKIQQILAVKKNMLIEKAATSTNPSDVIKAAQNLQYIQERANSDRKSFVIDPYQYTQSFGFKDKPFALSYNTLRRMGNVPIINAIIKTRKNQVASFCEPQSDKYTTGFVIRKKQFVISNTQIKPTKEEEKEIEELTQMILDCGMNGSWEADDFDGFVRKIVQDSLCFDQYTFEIIRNRKGKVVEFLATDASTFRIADSYDDDDWQKQMRSLKAISLDKKQKVKGYYPSYVQIMDSVIKEEYYPWELCFGIRNPTTSIYNYGYGVSELEDLVTTITSMIWGDEYNRKFFSQGAAPKGLLKFKGHVNEKTLSEFKQQWQAMVTGVNNAWRTPMLDGDVDWVDLQKSNQDMEYSKWQEYLIKISCAVFAIDPAEVNFPLQGGSNDANPMFGGNNENRIKYSRDKGLYPLLRHIQRRINKFLISQVNPKYEFVFVGMDGLSRREEMDMDVIENNNWAKVDEIRERRGYKKLKDNEGNYINSAMFLQNKQAAQQSEMMVQQGQPDQSSGGQESNENQEEETGEENPFTKAWDSYLKETLNK